MLREIQFFRHYLVQSGKYAIVTDKCLEFPAQWHALNVINHVTTVTRAQGDHAIKVNVAEIIMGLKMVNRVRQVNIGSAAYKELVSGIPSGEKSIPHWPWIASTNSCPYPVTTCQFKIVLNNGMLTCTSRRIHGNHNVTMFRKDSRIPSECSVSNGIFQG